MQAENPQNMSLDEVELEVLAKIDLRMADFAPKK